jgi:hypothetical protein
VAGSFLPAVVEGQRFVVEPYLQAASPTSVSIHWETSTGGESVVWYGPDRKLEHKAVGSVAAGMRKQTYMHAVRLTQLEPNTRYFYRVESGRVKSDVFELRTEPRPENAELVRIVALSDTQWDFRQSRKLREIVEQGILRFAAHGTSPALSIDMVLVTGDLVSKGKDHREWAEHFFRPMHELVRSVPLYAVIGNHEENHPLYFRYLELPSNAPAEFAEHFWWHDQGNVRVVGLDSNKRYRNSEQLAWLDRVLEDACEAEHVDFVVAAAHHPEKSELWPEGEEPYMGLVAERLEQLASACDKPTVLLTGHTHGYARGHSRDHAFTMVSVATAAGSIDHFGDHERQVDYPEYVLSEGAYGFVVLEAMAGDDPSLRIQRVNRGTERHVVDNELADEVRLYRHNQPPNIPVALAPDDEQVDPRHVVLVASTFKDPDGDPYGATHWQVSDGSCDFGSPIVDRWVQYSDVFAGVQARVPADATELALPPLRENAQYCFRVRMRDRSLAWSAFSEPSRFRTTGQAVARAQGPRAE